MTRVFINGQSGTTGLRLHERLSERSDIQLVAANYEKRRDPDEVLRCMRESDVCFLCLPDDAACEAVSIAENTDVRIIDASTAHRTADGWAYGFPELSDKRRRSIEASSRVAVPGCHASGMVALTYPLITAGILPNDYPLSFTSLTGYSGAGKAVIADYETESRPAEFFSPRLYAMGQRHKHMPEVTGVCSLSAPPVFFPVIDDYYSGMIVTVALHTRLLAGTPGINGLWRELSDYYAASALISVREAGFDGFLHAEAMSGRDDMEIYVTGNDERVQLSARFDNLGKGASGAAIQCFNIMTGADEAFGLNLGLPF